MAENCPPRICSLKDWSFWDVTPYRRISGSRPCEGSWWLDSAPRSIETSGTIHLIARRRITLHSYLQQWEPHSYLACLFVFLRTFPVPLYRVFRTEHGVGETTFPSIQINHQPDATIFQFIILTFIYSSTPEAATAVIELLMMGGKTPETCWAVNKGQDNKLENCCIWLAIYLNCTMMHGLTNLKDITCLVISVACECVDGCWFYICSTW